MDMPARRMVQQIFFEFYTKPMKPQRTILASSANPEQQKRTTLTQECIRRLRNTRKQLSCVRKQEILSDYMQVLKNSGYQNTFRKEILKAGLHGYNKILEADELGKKPLYRAKNWRKSSRWLDSKKKSRNWLGGKYKSCIFVPPTPGSELRKRMQKVEQEMRPGGREDWPIKVIEMAGKPLEKALVKTDPLDGNSCNDKSCLPNRNKKNRISCRRNNVGYRIQCKICLMDGRSKCDIYIGETGENMHVRMKSHLTKYYSKKQDIRESSTFIKHLQNSHGGVREGSKFEDYFDIEIVKAYNKPLTRQTEEGTFMVNVKGELLNSKTEWHQPKIIRTTIHTGGAEMAGGRVLPFPQAGLQGSQVAGSRALPLPQDGRQRTQENAPRANSIQEAEPQPLRRSTRSTRCIGK